MIQFNGREMNIDKFMWIYLLAMIAFMLLLGLVGVVAHMLGLA